MSNVPILPCFKKYDVRGRLGETLDEGIVYRIGRAFAAVMAPSVVVTGRDCRTTSGPLQDALHRGLMDQGVDVVDLGLCGTEEVYFATDHYQTGGGLMVTASHNPIDYNGVKMVQAGARPISNADGMQAIHDMAAANVFPEPDGQGALRTGDCRAAYVERVLSFVDVARLAPLRVLVNAGNGAAGPTFDAIAAALDERGSPVTFLRHNHTPDGTFPNGIPNPLLPENQNQTSDPIKAKNADIGVAWDGDFDRCFFFDETGAFLDGEYVVSVLAQVFLAHEAGARIVYDNRVVCNTQTTVRGLGGVPVAAQTGHAFMKAKMREYDAVYGGEMSAHHYFRNFMYCDSGMIPFLVMLEYLSVAGRPFSELVAGMRADFPSSGEINFHIADPAVAMTRINAAYCDLADDIDHLDGVAFKFPTWRFSLRQSNTEPVVRLNVETTGDAALLTTKVAEISAILTA